MFLSDEEAKVAGKSVEAVREFGGFVSKYFEGTLEQAIGIFEDKLKYMRWERQIRLMEKANNLLANRGITKLTKKIPLKLGIPLLEAASLEDDDYLQDLWVNLLVNASDIDSGIELQRSYIDILERLSPLEARLMNMLYSLPYEEYQHTPIRTEALPSGFINKEEMEPGVEPLPEVKLALANLTRLGCIAPSKTFGGGEHFSQVNLTFLGKMFVDACNAK